MMILMVLYGIIPQIQEFYRPDFFHHNDENGVFSQFWSFGEKVYFITWIWKQTF